MLCAQIGVSASTGIRWLIEDAVQKKKLTPPTTEDKSLRKPQSGGADK